ncbi:MAG: bile acid:sodium symporter [Thermodesulfobacteriota bacterium]|nr:bile acid:sodium symporter [Thermodesulfobacteriota bacterium]
MLYPIFGDLQKGGVKNSLIAVVHYNRNVKLQFLPAMMDKWLKARQGPDAVIFLVFLFSGMLLNPRLIRSGLSDISGTLLALALIFLIAPAITALAGLAPLQTCFAIGLFLVAVMPTTMSSGVVMSVAAGGNPAHALFITILANIICMFTIPLTFPLLLNLTNVSREIVFNRLSVMIKIALYVLVSLCIGLGVKYRGGCPGQIRRAEIATQILDFRRRCNHGGFVSNFEFRALRLTGVAFYL